MVEHLPFLPTLIVRQGFGNSSIYNMDMRDITERNATLTSWKASAMLPLVSADAYPPVTSAPRLSSVSTAGPGFVYGDGLHLSTCCKGQGLSWLVHLHLWLLPDGCCPHCCPCCSHSHQKRIWDLFPLTNHQKATNSSSFICETKR